MIFDVCAIVKQCFADLFDEISAVSPDLAISSGRENGAGGVTLNDVGGSQQQTIHVVKHVNLKNSQLGIGL